MAIINYPKFQVVDSNGDPLTGGKLYFYEQGTSTLKTVYSDPGMTTAHASPVVLDSLGENVIYGSGYYKIILKDSDDTEIWTVDEYLAGDEVDWVSISDYDDSLNTAVSEIGATPTTLLIDKAVTISQNVTVPATLHLLVLNINGGALQPANGITVTYNCPITAGAYRIFGGSGTHTKTGIVGPTLGKWTSGGSDDFDIPNDLTVGNDVTISGDLKPTDIPYLPGFMSRPKFVFTERLAFTSGGTHEILEGDTLTGATGGGTGVVEWLEVTSGTWAGGDAAGNLFLHTRNATAFEAENLNEGANSNVCTIAAASTKDSVVIYPGFYQHKGTLDQIVYWITKIGFIFGSGGSNAGSTDLGASEKHYLYIDDSALSGIVMTAAEFINNTTAPSYSAAKNGQYNSSDRCIFGIKTDGSNNIDEFFHNGEKVIYADQVTDRAEADLDASWTDVTLSIPGFCTEAVCTFLTNSGGDGERDTYWRTNGQTGTGGHLAGRSRVDNNAQDEQFLTASVITDSGQKIEVKQDGAGAGQTAVYTDAWLFPIGM